MGLADQNITWVLEWGCREWAMTGKSRQSIRKKNENKVNRAILL